MGGRVYTGSPFFGCRGLAPTDTRFIDFSQEVALRFVLVPAFGTLTLIALVLSALIAVSLALPAGRRFLAEVVGDRPIAALGLALAVATIATLGSLYLSEGMELEPCKLCWFQRIAMYPLVIVLGVAMLRRDADAWKTALPLALLGGVISAYHVALQYNPALEVTSCSASAPCSTRLFVLHGFISIPVMAGAAFLLIGLTLAVVASSRQDLLGDD